MNTRTKLVPGFAVCGGTVAGRHHVHAGRNNQDAFAFKRTPGGLFAVVCDGCSSGAHSEVGARVGAQLLVQAVASSGARGATGEDAVLAELSRLAEAMSGESPGSAGFTEVVAESFLFTVVGVALLEDRAFSFALGDGALAVNGEKQLLGPFPGNEPPYLAYSLCGKEPSLTSRWALEVKQLPDPSEIRSLALATDGAAELDLAPFLADPRVLTNPDMVRRLLWQQARARRLDDDATVVVIRRVEGEGTP